MLTMVEHSPPTSPDTGDVPNNDHLVRSDRSDHPAHLIPSLCAKFWTLGWVTGTGGGVSIRDGYGQGLMIIIFVTVISLMLH